MAGGYHERAQSGGTGYKTEMGVPLMEETYQCGWVKRRDGGFHRTRRLIDHVLRQAVYLLWAQIRVKRFRNGIVRYERVCAGG